MAPQLELFLTAFNILLTFVSLYFTITILLKLRVLKPIRQDTTTVVNLPAKKRSPIIVDEVQAEKNNRRSTVVDL